VHKTQAFSLLFVVSLLASCTSDEDFWQSSPSFGPQNNVSFEVQVYNHENAPVVGVVIGYGNEEQGIIQCEEETDNNGRARISVPGFISEGDLLNGGFVQAMPNASFVGGYISITDLEEVQVIEALAEETIEIEFLKSIDQKTLVEGTVVDASIRVTSTTRHPLTYIFNSATSVDGIFQLEGRSDTYACPRTNSRGEVALSFRKTGDNPSLLVKLTRHDFTTYEKEMLMIEE